VWRIAEQWREQALEAGPLSPGMLTADERALRRKTHDTIRRVTVDIDQRKQMNTAVSAMMELVNDLYGFTDKGARSDQAGAVAREAIEALILLVSPFAPHTSEELWERYGHQGGLAAATWPVFDAEAARAELLVLPVQVNGKVRGRISVAPDADASEVEAAALQAPSVLPYLEGRTVKKIVVAAGRLVSIVVA
jgi:leucyl-tRNA synthetase